VPCIYASQCTTAVVKWRCVAGLCRCLPAYFDKQRVYNERNAHFTSPAGHDRTVLSVSCLAERCTLRNNACSDFKLSVCDSLHSSGTTVRLYNWHSAGFLGWPFPMLQYKCIFREKNIRKQSYQTAHANCYDLNSLKS